jgi:phosphoenolpyruvate synthase/pyruvate phosphate dikinase
MMETVGPVPLIVRSSSLLEDNFGTSFAGKYESVFCPNQGSPEENLRALTLAIAQVYASALNPDALLYRRSKGLQDYDERMGILIQVVQGERVGKYYFPQVAGVGFSRNLSSAGRLKSGARTVSSASSGDWARAPSSASATTSPVWSP